MNYYNKKNILIDLNVLLQGYFENKAKGGVYWVSYEIINEMIKNYSDQFNFYGHFLGSEKFYNQKFIKTLPEFQSIKYISPDSLFEKFHNRCNFFIKTLKFKQKNTKNKIEKKILFFPITLIRFFKFLKIFLPRNTNKLNNIDIYQTFMGTTGIQKSIQENIKLRKFAFIYDVMPITNPEYFFKESKYKKSIKSFSRKMETITSDTNIFSDSDFATGEFLKVYPKYKDNNILTIHLAADSNKFFPTKDINKEILKKYNIDKNKKYFLSLSSLNKRKNLALLIDSFVDFLEKNPNINDINLVLAGPKGWLLDELLKSINNADKYKDRITLTGFIDPEDINTIYNGSFAFVFPSLMEGFGMPVLEAMQCGLPVISSNSSSLPEVYNDAALSFNPLDKNELTEKLEIIYNDKNIRNELIKKSLERSKDFSWNKAVKIMMKEILK